jgi:hypothetical protein
MELNQANSNRISYFGINFSILYEKLRLHFTGSGLAALMTVYKMIQSGAFQNKSILLIDQDPKKPMIVLGVFGKTDLRLGNNQLLNNGIWLCLLTAIFIRIRIKTLYPQPNQS